MAGISSVPDPYYAPAPRGVFSTKIPASVCFTVGILLFLLPFAEIRCSPSDKEKGNFLDMAQIRFSFTNTGLGLALGNSWKADFPSADIGNGERKDEWQKNIKPQRPNSYAIVALTLAVVALGLSFTSSRAWLAVATGAGALSAVSLLGLMIDLEKKSKDIIDNVRKANDSLGGDYQFSLIFTPWFYISVIALLVAAVFSYKRIQLLK